MKIIRTALKFDLVNDVSQSDLPFDNLFGNDNVIRKVIPLRNESLFDMVELLENGDTKTQSKYKVDLDKKVVYKVQNGQIDYRAMRPGKVIKKELGPGWADEWSKQVNSINNEDYSIIISRSPIDVARMSDHEEISSCHSPNESYFSNAIEEAKEGGGIAYVVPNKDLNYFIDKYGQNALQNQDIFQDPERGVEGISPQSRIRINRYVKDESDSDEYQNEIAIPVTKTYGNYIAGFYDSIKKWFHDQQSSFIDYNELDMSDYKRTGGQYADKTDNELIKKFFNGDNKGVTGNLPSQGSQTRIEIFQTELDSITKEFNSKLKYCEVFANIDMMDENEEALIDAGVIIKFGIQGKIINEISFEVQNEIINQLLKNIIEKHLGTFYLDTISNDITLNFDYNESTNITTIELPLQFNGIRDPDDVYSVYSEMEDLENRDYVNMAYQLRSLLIDFNIISSYNIKTREDYEQNFAKMGFGFSDGPDILTVNWKLPFKLEAAYWKHINSLKEDRFLKNDLQNLFKNRLPVHMKNQIEKLSQAEQTRFEFMQNDVPWDNWQNNPLFKGNIPVLNVNMEILNGYTFNKQEMSLIIYISESEVYKFGMQYFYILSESIPYIIEDLSNKIYEIDKYKSSLEKRVEQSFSPVVAPETTQEETQKTQEKNEFNEINSGLSWYSKFKVGQALEFVRFIK